MTTSLDNRIQTLTDELNRLRNSTCQADNQLNSVLLKVTEIQLNLATQDRTLCKLDSSVNGNGKPGLLLRVDRTERMASTLVKAVWLLAAATVTGLIRLIIDQIR